MNHNDDKICDLEKGNKYLCKICEKLLFYKFDLLQNTEVDNIFCDKLFIKSQSWIYMRVNRFKIIGENGFDEYKIQCTGCSHTIGNYSLRKINCNCSLHNGCSDYLAVKIFKENVSIN